METKQHFLSRLAFAIEEPGIFRDKTIDDRFFKLLSMESISPFYILKFFDTTSFKFIQPNQNVINLPIVLKPIF